MVTKPPQSSPYYGNADYPTGSPSRLTVKTAPVARDPIDMRSLIPDGGDVTATNNSAVSTDDYQIHGPNASFELHRHDEAYSDPYAEK